MQFFVPPSFLINIINVVRRHSHEYVDHTREYTDHTREYTDHTREYIDHTREYIDHTREYTDRVPISKLEIKVKYSMQIKRIICYKLTFHFPGYYRDHTCALI